MLAEGGQASDGDFWFRILTSESLITKGKLHHAAFKGQIKPTKAEKNRSWSSEMSGRLRSIAGSVEEIKTHAADYCGRKNQKFSGVAFSRCADLRITFPDDPITAAVHLTPIRTGADKDPAHADLTFAGPVIQPKSEEEGRLLLTLHGRFAALYPDQIDKLLPNAVPDSWPSRLRQFFLRFRV